MSLGWLALWDLGRIAWCPTGRGPIRSWKLRGKVYMANGRQYTVSELIGKESGSASRFSEHRKISLRLHRFFGGAVCRIACPTWRRVLREGCWSGPR